MTRSSSAASLEAGESAGGGAGAAKMKTEADNPTLGLLICKDMDKVEAQYALESTIQPLGISSYELSKLIPEEFRGSMPTIEEIEAELNE